MICPHMNFNARVAVNRLEDVGRFTADVTIECADCGEPFHFKGLPMGSSPDRPMVSVDGLELRAPIGPGMTPFLGSHQ